MPPGRIIFVTGTDTGVGKTLLTGLLLQHLRSTGHGALAMKPFCSGGTADVDILFELQGGELNRQQINPFYFSEPVAPLVAARKTRRKIPLAKVLQSIKYAQNRCKTLIIEGSGGLLVPLGENYSVADLISKLSCSVIVASRNRLGTINHTLLTVQTLKTAGKRRMTIVLMDQQARDLSSKTNAQILSELLAPIPLFHLPCLGPNLMRCDRIKTAAAKVAATLSEIAKGSPCC